MKKCFIYDSSLKFTRAVAGALVLIAFFLKNYWLILIASILVGLRVFSVKIDILYQLHAFIAKKLFKKNLQTHQKETAELNFVSGMMAGLLFFGLFIPLFRKIC